MGLKDKKKHSKTKKHKKNNKHKTFSFFRKKSSSSDTPLSKPQKKKKPTLEGEENQKIMKKIHAKKDTNKREVRKVKTNGPKPTEGINMNSDSNEENEPPKKPAKLAALKGKQPSKITKKRIKNTKTTATTDMSKDGTSLTNNVGVKVKTVSDTVKKSKKDNTAGKCETTGNGKIVNFGAGDEISTTTEENIKKVGGSLLDTENDDDLTKKEQKEKDKNKEGSTLQSEKWKSLVNKLLRKGNHGIAREFTNISGYLPKSATRREFDRNMDKNRFEDVVCIDQTRVRLNGDSYIHANWVEISDTKKAILTQLPMGHTAADFWQMVLEQDVQAILLIATAYEFRTFNGDATFPAKSDFLHCETPFVHIRVGEFNRRQITKEWTMHTLCVNNGERKKFVHVHHYYGWAHGLAPRAIADIWQIQSVLRKYSGPPVYMSLSGCGRAGTYAAFEIAHDRLHSSDYSRVDISECIKKVRKDRMHSVQRPTQLRTIYLLIAEHIVNNGYDKSLSDEEKAKLATIIRSAHLPM